MIEAVIFDFGGVLIRTKSWHQRLAWDDKLGLEPGTVEELFFNSESGRAAQHGAHSEVEQWAYVRQELGLSAESLTQLKDDFWAQDVLDEALIEYIRALRPAHKTAIISNAMDGLRPYLAELGIIDAFDVVVISAEFRTMKPNPSIYMETLKQLDVEPEAAVFIDDFEHNIEGARAVNMHGIHYPPKLQTNDLIAALAELGVGSSA